VTNRTFEENLELLREVFRRLCAAQLRINPEKCNFCWSSLKYLGHIVYRKGIRTDPKKVSAITDWPTPTTVRKIRQFLGVASWYRRFIADFSLAAPLTNLTKKTVRWAWEQPEQQAFQ